MILLGIFTALAHLYYDLIFIFIDAESRSFLNDFGPGSSASCFQLKISPFADLTENQSEAKSIKIGGCALCKQ